MISAAWAEPVRQEITQANLSAASVAIPLARLDSAMKTGKIIFKWGELIEWLDTSSSLAASPHKETPLEVPLKVIIPLFMAQRQATEVSPAKLDFPSVHLPHRLHCDNGQRRRRRANRAFDNRGKSDSFYH